MNLHECQLLTLIRTEDVQIRHYYCK